MEKRVGLYIKGPDSDAVADGVSKVLRVDFDNKVKAGMNERYPIMSQKKEDLLFLARQVTEAKHEGAVTCECGLKLPLWGMVFRCFYCGCWFCRKCAGKHFGDEEEGGASYDSPDLTKAFPSP